MRIRPVRVSEFTQISCVGFQTATATWTWEKTTTSQRCAVKGYPPTVPPTPTSVWQTALTLYQEDPLLKFHLSPHLKKNLAVSKEKAQAARSRVIWTRVWGVNHGASGSCFTFNINMKRLVVRLISHRHRRTNRLFKKKKKFLYPVQMSKPSWGLLGHFHDVLVFFAGDPFHSSSDFDLGDDGGKDTVDTYFLNHAVQLYAASVKNHT